MELKDQLIELIRENKISTTEVSDALGKRGHIPGPLPLTPSYHLVGEVHFIYTYEGSNYPCHEQVKDMPKGKIAYVHAIDCGTAAIFGDIVSKYMLLYRRSVAIVTNGYLRDVHRLVKERYPLWCAGRTPIGCVNAKPKNPPPAEVAALREKFQGAIMVCDDSGVVLIEKHEINQKLVDRLKFIELQEDIWYYCMDSLKMSTFEVICEKKYLTEPGIIDKRRLDELERLK
ncbi:MAG: RraA family protein [Bdellovibrionota bacterium]